jgi:tRNA pseudouridine38-40 synthase
MERTLRLTLEYDGSGFAGWARQPERRTVEGTVGDALDALWPGSVATLAVAGRTDAGVHASHQVLSVVVDGGPPAGRAADALRSLLAGDIAVVSAREARPGFHARFSALARRYEYRVLARRARSPLLAARALHHPSPVDRAALDACAGLALGEHDFRAFTPAATRGTRTRRHVTACEWSGDGDELVLSIEADAFLHHMVRTLVGTMLQVARGARDVGSFARLLEGAARDAAGPTAPPHALTLTGVRYAGDGPGSDELLCLVTRERGGARELLVLEHDGACGVPRGTFEPEERIDAAAHREVHAQTGIELSDIPRPLGVLVDESAGGAPTRARVVWLRAPAGLADSWEFGPPGAFCRFVPLPTELGASLGTQLARLGSAV